MRSPVSILSSTSAARCTGWLGAGVLAATLSAPAAAGAQTRVTPDDELNREIFKELVEMDTSPEGGAVSRASQAVARRLIAAGFPAADVHVIGPVPTCLNVVATLAGRDRRATPILLLAHLDVVPARRADWTFDPFVLREEGGWFFGRGATDNKAGASVIAANMIRWKREGYTPSRDVILVFTCDEETTAENGMQWLVTNVPRLKEADYALNSDAGGANETKGGKVLFDVQAAEKVYVTFTLKATNPGGHSSVPRPDNAIYALSAALVRLSRHVFPVTYNEVSQAAFSRGGDLEAGQLADDMRAAGRGQTEGPAIERLAAVPHLNAQLRTTCVTTMLTGGHAENALPQSASATVNCRIVPGTSVDAIRSALTAVVADPSVTIALTYPPVPSPPSPLRPDVMSAITRITGEFWKNAVVVPGMSTGATDGLYLRNAGVPVYGVSAILMDPEQDRSHGLDERVPVKSLYDAREFWYRLVKALTGPR